MRRLLLLLGVGVATSLASWLGWRYGAVTLPYGTVMSPMPIPEDGKVLGGIYVNDYCDLSYPLPEGWTEGPQGPAPSDTGYYVLSELIPQSAQTATILIAAQDMFFATKPHCNIAETAHDLRQTMSAVDSMTLP